MRKIGVLCFTEQGGRIARQIRDGIGGEIVLRGGKHVTDPEISPYENLSETVKDWFSSMDAIVFVGACGIAVRAVAPFLKDKCTDPAIVAADETGQFVVSLLSGHVGGANELAGEIAGVLSAVPVITTATDLHHQFAVDLFAMKNDLLLTDRILAKEISAALLHGEAIGFESDYPVKGDISCFSKGASLGILVSHWDKSPFEKTLYLKPKNLVAGIGCKKGVSLSQVERAVEEAMRSGGFDKSCLRQVRSIDRKQDEPGLLRFIEKNGLRSSFYPAETLRQAQGVFTASAFVEETVGVDNVCERCAVMEGGTLLIKKTARDGVTVALGELPLTLEV